MNISSRAGLAIGCLVAGAIGGFLATERMQLKADQQVPRAVAIPPELTSYRDIVKDALPAVVSIVAKAKNKQPARLDIAPVQEPRGEIQLGFGSGVIVDQSGVILTNFHVVDGADSLEVRLTDGRKFVPTAWYGDRKSDIAVIRIASDKPLPFLTFGDSDLIEVGDRVLAIGAPFGLAGSVTHGIISAKSRNVRLNQYEDFVQTDAAINPGNSGGPLISLDGKIIGLNSAIKSKSGGFQGIGLAISSNLAKTIMKQLLKEGTVRRGYLGAQVRDIDVDLGAKLGVKEGTGVLVTRIYDQSPASKAGLKLSDIVVSIDGKAVHDSVDLQRVISGLQLDVPVDVSLWREGRSVQLKVTIEKQPDDFGTTPKGNR